MGKIGNPRSYRLGELLGPLKAKAKSEDTTQTEILKRALRAYLDKNDHEIAGRLKGEEGDSRVTVRFGSLVEPLESRAASEHTTSSAIARRAVRLYLANGEVPKILQFMDELREHHANLARIGGNLNRIARLVNTDGILARSDLGQVHIALIEAFKPLADLYKRVEKTLDRQRP